MGFFDTIDNSMLSNNCLKERTVKCISPEYASFFTEAYKTCRSSPDQTSTSVLGNNDQFSIC